MSEPLTPEDLEFSADVFDACIGTLVFDTLGAARLQELYPDMAIITPRDWQGHAARLRAAASTIRDLQKRAVPEGYYQRTAYEGTFDNEDRSVWVYYPDGPGEPWKAYTDAGYGEGETAEKAIRAAPGGRPWQR